MKRGLQAVLFTVPTFLSMNLFANESTKWDGSFVIAKGVASGMVVVRHTNAEITLADGTNIVRSRMFHFDKGSLVFGLVATESGTLDVSMEPAEFLSEARKLGTILEQVYLPAIEA